MEEMYEEITSQLDAREVLRYLNNLGIHNISAELLKHFITDLKKLIKYDLQQKYGKESGEPPTCDLVGPERLHSATTISSRIKSKNSTPADLKCTRNCSAKKIVHLRNTKSAPLLGQKPAEEKPLRRACSCVRVEKKLDSESISKPSSSCANLIKVPKVPLKKKSDPVSLYHYYTALWARYKPNFPGENNWADLRWEMRQKMVAFSDQPAKPTGKKKLKENRKP